MYTLLNPCDQIELPNTTLELPRAQRHERKKQEDRERARHCQKGRRVITSRGAPAAGMRTTATAPAASATASHRVGVRGRHGMLCMFCIDSGIIL